MIAKKKTSEKDIDPSEFYLFNTIDDNVSLFDASMDYPIRYGKINTITPILSYYKNKLKNQFRLYQFSTDDKVGFKKDFSPEKIIESNISFPAIGFPTFPNRKFISKTKIRDLVYYHFRINPTTHILFDSEMDSPIQYGSKLNVTSQYGLMPKNSTVFYFEKDRFNGFKLKMAIKSDQQKKSEEDVKITSEIKKNDK